MDLKKASVEQLKAELAEREKLGPPRPRMQPDFSKLETFIKEGVQQVAHEGCSPKDFNQYVFELAMEAFYGREIWDWYNKANEGE